MKQNDPLKLKENVKKYVDDKSDELISLSRKIWEYAEVALEEYKSSKLLADVLEKDGFTVERKVANLKTAFIASWGKGAPKIGVLAEYDALPNLSAVERGKPGHACGHNLLGTAAVGSALAAKKAMEASNLSGTIRVYGCPSEENLYGKVMMASAKVFDDLDVALEWHPDTITKSPYESMDALDNKVFRFHGKSAHGSKAWEGKSALDAAQIFTIAIEFNREQIMEKDKIHYVITQGGSLPNIIPDFSEVWVFIRSPDMRHLMELTRKVDLCAIAASLATDTSVDIERKVACHMLLPNKTISLAVNDNLNSIGAPKLSDEEKKRVSKQLSQKYGDYEEKVMPPTGWEVGGDWVGQAVSTDVGDVSWIVPTNGMFSVSIGPRGVPAHNADQTILSGSSIGSKAMLVAAKTLGCTIVDLLTKPDIIVNAKKEFKKRKELSKWNYEPLLPSKIEYTKNDYVPKISLL